MAKRLLEGMKVHTETLATGMFEGINFKGDFLHQRATRELFPKEQFLPSAVLDRGSIRTWQQTGRLDTWDRARTRAAALLDAYQRPDLPAEQVAALTAMVQRLAADAGMASLPALEAV